MPLPEFKVADADFVDFKVLKDLSAVVSVVVSCSLRFSAAVTFLVTASFSDPCDAGGEWLLFGIISVEVVVGDVDKSLSSVRDVDEGGDGKDEHDNDALASWSDLKQNSSSERSPARR